MAALLEAKVVGKRFGGVQALAGVSFSIRRGEIYGLIGPNGAGKTTLFNVLSGIYAPDAGSFLPPIRASISAPRQSGGKLLATAKAS